MSYPPAIDKRLDYAGSCLLAIKVEDQATEAADNNPEMVAVALKSGSDSGGVGVVVGVMEMWEGGGKYKTKAILSLHRRCPRRP